MQLRNNKFMGWGALMMTAAFAILGAAVPAKAYLGGGLASVQEDQLHLQGIRKTTEMQAFTVHEIQAATGTKVREYVSAEGKVFAIAFEGAWLPDMHQLLGTYFAQYSRAVQADSAVRVGRHPLVIDEPGLSVRIGGRPRAYAGKVYASDMLPSGVRPEDIR